MRKPAGFWKRPTNRIYSYNLGEQCYSPIGSCSNYGSYGAPGSLTYSERLGNRWMESNQYGPQSSSYSYSYGRSSSMTRGSTPMTSSYRRAYSNPPAMSGDYQCPGIFPWEPQRDVNNVSAFGCYKQALLDTSDELRQNSFARQSAMAAHRGTDTLAELRAKQAAAREQIVAQTLSKVYSRPEIRRTPPINRGFFSAPRQDDFVSAWSHCGRSAGADVGAARSTILEFDRELQDIMKRASTTQTFARQTANNLSMEGMMSGGTIGSTFSKSRKAMMESSRRMGGWR